MPFPLEMVVRRIPVPTAIATTSAEGTAAPDESRSIPVSWALLLCAGRPMADRRKDSKSETHDRRQSLHRMYSSLIAKSRGTTVFYTMTLTRTRSVVRVPCALTSPVRGCGLVPVVLSAWFGSGRSRRAKCCRSAAPFSALRENLTECPIGAGFRISGPRLRSAGFATAACRRRTARRGVETEGLLG